MALIRCRKCGRTVLSAASQCAHCMQPMDADQRDEIRVDGRPMRWPSIVVASAAILIAVVVWRNLEDAAASLNSGRAQVAATQDASDAESLLGSKETTRMARELKARPRETGVPNEAVRTVSIPNGAEPLWAPTWVNVRERPGPEGLVIRVLNPGQKVLVVDPRRDWSAVYVDDQRIGYVWVRGLARQPRSD